LIVHSIESKSTKEESQRANRFQVLLADQETYQREGKKKVGKKAKLLAKMRILRNSQTLKI
jgi:hypothetical protein